MSIIITQIEGRKVPRYQLKTSGKTRTKQADKESADINNIVAKAYKTGMLPVTQAQALYADVSGVLDYQQAMEIQLRAQEQFDALPAETRNKFDHDPSKFLAFAQDEANKKEIIELVTGVKIKEKKPFDKTGLENTKPDV